MSTILITGASGFIGRTLARSLATRHEVVCMSRRACDSGIHVSGDFANPDDLRLLERWRFDAVIHLAAVTTGNQRDGIVVNVEGTRALMRHCIDRGCAKFVLASSIAAVGAQHRDFRPLQLPIGDEHPCLDRLGYGFSKFMMEEVSRYCHRQSPHIDVINLRLAAIFADVASCPPQGLRQQPEEWALCSLTGMTLADAVRAITAAVEAPSKPGVRTLNAAGPRVWATVPTAAILRHWWRDSVDLSSFDDPTRRFASVYAVGRIKEELGFEACELPA